MVCAAVPDFRNDVEELFIDEGERAAAAQLRYSGTHEGMLFGRARTGVTIGRVHYEHDLCARRHLNAIDD